MTPSYLELVPPQFMATQDSTSDDSESSDSDGSDQRVMDADDELVLANRLRSLGYID